MVQRAILYGEAAEGLEQSINNVMESNSDVIATTFEERKRLELSLPNVV